MTSQWIKMRCDLWDDPRVMRICEITGYDEAPIVGALYWLWTTADQHTVDGLVSNLTIRGVNRKTGVAGFAEAMIAVGWLVEVDGGLQLPRFEEHNGSSAKRRAMDSSRKGSGASKSAETKPPTGPSGKSAAPKKPGPSSEPSAETENPSSKVWRLWTDLVGDTPHNRSVLGKLIKEHGEAEILEAVMKTIAKNPAEPISYLRGVIRPKRRFVC